MTAGVIYPSVVSTALAANTSATQAVVVPFDALEVSTALAANTSATLEGTIQRKIVKVSTALAANTSATSTLPLFYRLIHVSTALAANTSATLASVSRVAQGLETSTGEPVQSIAEAEHKLAFFYSKFKPKLMIFLDLANLKLEKIPNSFCIILNVIQIMPILAFCGQKSLEVRQRGFTPT